MRYQIRLLKTLILIMIFNNLNAQIDISKITNDMCECLLPQKESMMTSNKIPQCFNTIISKSDSIIIAQVDTNSKISRENQIAAIKNNILLTCNDSLIANCDFYFEEFEKLKLRIFIIDDTLKLKNDLDSVTSKLKYDSLNLNLWYKKAELLIKFKQFDNAKHDLLRVLMIDNKNAITLTFIGMVDEYSGNLDNALENYNKAYLFSKQFQIRTFISIVKRKQKQINTKI